MWPCRFTRPGLSHRQRRTCTTARPPPPAPPVERQSLWYMHLGLWLCVLTALGGSEVTTVSLGHFFSSTSIRVSFAGGWVAIIASFLNALGGSVRHAPTARGLAPAPRAYGRMCPPRALVAAPSSYASSSSAPRSASTLPRRPTFFTCASACCMLPPHRAVGLLLSRLRPL